MPKLLQLLAVFAITGAMQASCAGAGGQANVDAAPPQSASPAPETPAASAPLAGSLPGLDSLRELSYTPGDLVKEGRGFLPGDDYSALASVPASTTQLLLEPSFDPAAPGSPTDLAYAVYGFTLEDYDLAADVQLAVAQAQDYADLWLAFSNWEASRWDIYPLDEATAISFTQAQFARFIEPGSSACYIALIATGTQPWTIGSVTISEVQPPQFINEGALASMNLEGVTDWSRAYTFTDAFKHARWWISQPSDQSQWDDGRPIDTDGLGWVRSLEADQVAAAIVLTGQLPNRSAGQYVLLYDGEGTIGARLDLSVASSQPGRIVMDHTPTEDGLGLILIQQTNPENYIRNMRLVPIEYESTFAQQTFHPDFLTSLEPFNVLRFMDLMATNHNPTQTWAERTTPQHYSQAREQGVCVEHLVELANETLADPWFCMPHAADDDYILQFATYVRDNLDPQLRAYVEYSNEVWNGIFTQAGYAQQEGLARGLSTDGWEAQMRFHSVRTVETMAIWDEVFAAEPERLVRVMGGWASVPFVNETILDYENAYQHLNALAVAPYFGHSLGSPERAEATAAKDISEILLECGMDSTYNHLGSETEDGTTEQNRAICDARGLSLYAYEGGQHLVGYGGAENNQVLTDKLTAANRDPGMRQVIYDDLANWNTAGGELFMYFSHTGVYGKWGSWGALEYQNQDRSTAPKWQALLDYLADYQ